MPISYKVIGRHIRDARKSAGLTQEAAANQLGLSPEHYGKVERGERTVNLERLVQISHLYGTTVCALLEGFDTEAAATVTQRPAEMAARNKAVRSCCASAQRSQPATKTEHLGCPLLVSGLFLSLLYHRFSEKRQGKDEKSFAIFRGFMPAGVTNLSRSRIAELLVK